MELIDTHCHIHFADYPIDSATAIENATAAGVSKMICVGCSLGDSQLAVELARKFENVWASVGAHPHDGKDFLCDPKAQAKLKQLINEPKVVAIGEIGLDYFHQHVPRDQQEIVLRQQLEIGQQSGLPIIFHVRDAWDDFWRILADYDIKHAVVHSFSATKKELDQVLQRGFLVGLNGIMTFTKDEQQLEAAKQVPLERLILETDAPFLTPKPHRGKVCEPKHVRDTAEFLATLRGEELEILAKKTTANAKILFGI